MCCDVVTRFHDYEWSALVLTKDMPAVPSDIIT